jgi:hypothetical protein
VGQWTRTGYLKIPCLWSFKVVRGAGLRNLKNGKCTRNLLCCTSQFITLVRHLAKWDMDQISERYGNGVTRSVELKYQRAIIYSTSFTESLRAKHQTSNVKRNFIYSTNQYSHIISFHPFQRPLSTARSYFVPRLFVLPTKFK